ncbi:PREDICTED: follitropin subunit beta-like [Poecilia mexicana]|uniref:follitropin subunit beta-like n=1 Tax=Poecilia mexicana TaxID=48701 RepID=UPI00072E7BE0|nr:PREDICTED: follitropin subunit beta-like [Poecilia mexicana]
MSVCAFSSMPLFILRRTLLFALMVGAVYTCTLMNHTIWLEKKNCTQCVAVNTTICSGYCYTRDTNLKGSFGRAFLIQRSCVPISLVYRAVFIPGCPQDVGSQLYYPAARCCSCRRCDTRTHHCVKPRPYSYDQCSVKLGGVEKQNLKCFGNLTTCS